MKFFEEQDKARRNTKYLVILFVAAVAVLIALTNLVVASLFFFEGGDRYGEDTFLLISLIVVGSIVIAIISRWWELSKGGHIVAEGLGGVLLQPNSDNEHERRCQNVVAEMALASGMPVPPIYVLQEQISLNAFAAGTSPADAVIGVTQGAIEQFDRAQLQGVIAHEFSHILNGDMCLNIRLMALLRGITFIGDFGEMSIYAGNRRRSDKRGNSQILGIGLVLIGWLGTLFATWIKSTISRQREFLADASAVQFTRDPHGIADALKLLGGYSRGSAVMSPGSQEASHLFIAPALASIFQFFSTHPPIDVRIRRLEPSWNGEFIQRDVRLHVTEGGRHSTLASSAGWRTGQKIHAPLDEDVMLGVNTGLAAALGGAAIGKTPDLPKAPIAYELPELRLNDMGLPSLLAHQAREPFGAMALLYVLLLADTDTAREQQISLLSEAGVQGLELQVRQLFADVKNMSVEYRLPLLELCLPALKTMSEVQYGRLRALLIKVARADDGIDMFDWCLYQLVTHYLNSSFGIVKPSHPRYRKVAQVQKECCLIYSMLAREGHSDEGDAAAAYSHAAAYVGFEGTTILSVEDCKIEAFSAAVNKLCQCYPLVKPLVLKGLLECIRYDRELTSVEVEIVTSIAAAMDCPMPALELD